VVDEHLALGGAANVAANLKAIGAEPYLLGTYKDDIAGRQLLALFGDLGIGQQGLVLDSSRPTIVKTRVIGHQQQMLRIDREELGGFDEKVIKKLKQSMTIALEGAGALIVSDYAKGVVGTDILEVVRSLCRKTGIPWIVDPKPAHKGLYVDATIMTPNSKELSELTGLPTRESAEVEIAGSRLINDLGLEGLLVTRSEKGMTLFQPKSSGEEPWAIPTLAREVFDVSGAGDTVIAVFAAALAGGAEWKQAAQLANAAAGIVVAKMGTATVTPEEITQG